MVIGIALLVDLSRVAVSLRTARRYGSAALRSNAFHFAGDMAGSVAVLGGIIAVRAGFEQGDAVAATVAVGQAHDVAERIEAALRGEPGVEDVQSHLEPLEQPVAAHPDEDGDYPDPAERQRISRLVVNRTGAPPRELRLLRASGGLVVFVSVAVTADMALPEAHGLASRLEDDIREGRPHVQDVVVHTQP